MGANISILANNYMRNYFSVPRFNEVVVTKAFCSLSLNIITSMKTKHAVCVQVFCSLTCSICWDNCRILLHSIR